MTNYPNSQDNNITLPGVSGITQEDIAINALREATFAIEKELGIVPSGIYTDVRARLDILEARIGFSIPSDVTNDGYIVSPLLLWNTIQDVTLSISDGYGAPTENRINGSLYMRADGYANNDFYIRRDGYWVPIQTEAFIAAGDLMGNHLSQTVIGLYGKPLNPTMATVGATQDGYHLTWNNADGYWEAQTGFIAASDLAADSPFFGRVGQRVVRLQNRTLSSAAPGGTTASNGDALVWNPIDVQWQPQVRAVIFDGYTTRTNLRSNRTLQSPIDNTKTGIVNFGSSSVVVVGSGTLENYSAILSGDKNTASAMFNLVAGGESNITSTSAYAAVLNGLQNSATGQYATVLNGNLNIASALQAFVADGYSNVASGARSFVINGGSNNTGATFSHILNGISNVVTAGATHSYVGGGSSNTIHLAGIYSVILGGSGNQVSASNVLMGPATDGYSQSNYTIIGTGPSHTIGTSSTFSTILNGTTNAIADTSASGLIGTGNNHTISGSNSIILNGNTNSITGNTSSVLNGNSNVITANFSIIGSGNNNTISGGISYGVILDGYNNTVSGIGSFIGDGYNNTVSGLYSSILNGNFNSVAGRNSTVINGANNSMDATSNENVILLGNANTYVNSSNAIVIGTSNTLTNVNNHFVLGASNNSQSTFSFINGSFNTLTSGTSFNRIFGSNNVLTSNTTANFISGSNNNIDGYGNSNILGSNNAMNADSSTILGLYGKSRLHGQVVHSNDRFTVGKVGEVQYSRVILDGYSLSGAAIPLQLKAGLSGVGTNMTFLDGYSYDMQIRVLVVNTLPIGPNPVVPARFVIDVLAHQEGGVLILDNVTQTLSSPNTSDDPTGATRSVGWTVSVTASADQLLVTVDPELDATNYVRPTGTPSNRRAVATVEMREMTRL